MLRKRKQRGTGRPFRPGSEHPLYQLGEKMATLSALQKLYQQKVAALAAPPEVPIDAEQMIRSLQTQLDAHTFGSFHELGIREGIVGCISCRRPISTFAHFLQHLRNEVLPPAIAEGLAVQRDQFMACHEDRLKSTFARE